MTKLCAVLAIGGMLIGSPIARADDHLVSRSTVDTRLAEAAAERAQNLASLDETLASPRAARVAAKAGIDMGEVRRALPLLSDADLRDLSQRAAALNSDPVAGYHEETYFLVTILLIVAIVLVILQAAR